MSSSSTTNEQMLCAAMLCASIEDQAVLRAHNSLREQIPCVRPLVREQPHALAILRTHSHPHSLFSSINDERVASACADAHPLMTRHSLAREHTNADTPISVGARVLNSKTGENIYLFRYDDGPCAF